jgi:FlaA1/EpsC-like NDP-sugar epimerase
MRRYFMTIPEAAQLVIQASTMGNGGEIFVLDMGQPIRILDLASNLILLSGLRPDKDIKIVFSGIRPGEKLYEELAHQDEEMQPTFHPKIKIFANHGLPAQDTLERVERLRSLCADRNSPDIILELKDLLLDYNPSAHLLRQVISRPREHPANGLPAIAVS